MHAVLLVKWLKYSANEGRIVELDRKMCVNLGTQSCSSKIDRYWQRNAELFSDLRIINMRQLHVTMCYGW